MKKTALPKSKAKTAYGLLSEIRKLILAEPKRYDQFEVRRRFTHAEVCEWPTHLPTCGTVGCVAGWVAVLKSPRTRDEISATERILGLDEDQINELVDSTAAGMRADLNEHAARGAAHIARFQRKYAAQLKAKAV